MYKKNLSSESQFLFSDAYLAAHELTFDTELSYISMDCLRDSGLTFNLGGHHFMFDADTMTVKETVVEGRLYTLVDLKEGCGARWGGCTAENPCCKPLICVLSESSPLSVCPQDLPQSKGCYCVKNLPPPAAPTPIPPTSPPTPPPTPCLPYDASKCIYVPTPAPGPAPGPAGTNYKGLRTWGNCHHIIKNLSASQCATQFIECQQPYAFPYYYYDKYAVRKMGNHNIQPNELISTTLHDASSICSMVSPQTWKQLNLAGDVTWNQIAQIFKANNPGKDKDCPYALILAIGECQNNTAQTGCQGIPQPNNHNYPASIWQNGDNSDNPDKSAKAIYDGMHSIQALCNGLTSNVPSIIPNGYISAGNTNWLGPFCHINGGEGAAWGGGMCAGGI